MLPDALARLDPEALVRLDHVLVLVMRALQVDDSDHSVLLGQPQLRGAGAEG